jgi:tetratricopeptide (TPR) repeat protein
MLPLIMAVCGAAGAVAGVFVTQAANEKDKQAAKKYEKVNAELINKRNEVEKSYYELSDRTKQQVNELNLKLAESEMEKDALYLAIRLQNNLISLMEGIEKNPSLEILVEFKKAIALTNHVLKELKENLVPVSQDYFSRNLIRIDSSNDYSKEQLSDFMSVLMNPEQEIINSFLSEIQNEIPQKSIVDSENFLATNDIKSSEVLSTEQIEELVKQGEKYIEKAQYEQALSCFDEIIAHKPSHNEALYYQSLIYYNFGENNKALELIDKAIDSNSSVGFYHHQKSICLSELNLDNEALKCINRAIYLEPDEDIFLHQKSSLLAFLKNYEEALQFIDRAIALNLQEFLYLADKGVYLSYLGRYDEALEYLDRAIEIEPNCDLAWYWRGLILFEMKMLLVFDRKDEALESFEKAISINPNEAEYWYWKSRCLKDLFKKKEALKAIEKAISIERNEEYLQLRDSLHR